MEDCNHWKAQWGKKNKKIKSWISVSGLTEVHQERRSVCFFLKGPVTVVVLSCDESSVYLFRRHCISHEEGLICRLIFFFLEMCRFLCHPLLLCYHFSCVSSCGASRQQPRLWDTAAADCFLFLRVKEGVCAPNVPTISCPSNIHIFQGTLWCTSCFAFVLLYCLLFAPATCTRWRLDVQVAQLHVTRWATSE